MAPVQNTFCVVPNAPSALNGDVDTPDSRPSRPPMTTKQAKKAYNKATKGPKLSKAERRRQELFEQDRIRREFEKEKSAARSKAARDKKKEKEDKERAERKKKGLPLIDVRPSQDTLARFMFPKAKKTKQPDSGQTVDEELKNEDCDQADVNTASDTVSTSEEPEIEPPSKRQKTESHSQHSPKHSHSQGTPKQDFRSHPPTYSTSQSSNATVTTSLSPRPATPPRSTKELFQPNTGTPRVKEGIASHSLNDSFGSVASLMDGLKTPEKPTPENTPPFGKPHDSRMPAPPTTFVQPCSQLGKKSTNPPSKPVRQSEEGNNSNNTPIGPAAIASAPNMARETMAKPTAAVSQATAREPLQPQTDSTHNIGTPEQLRKIAPGFTKTNNRNFPSSRPSEPPKPSPAAPNSSVFRRPQAKVMGPPSLPPKFKTPNSITTSQAANTSRFAPRRPPPVTNTSTPKPPSKPSTTAQSHREAAPPSSTQLFMLDHADELFPSPSQEVQELFNDLDSNPARSRTKPRNSRPTMEPPKISSVMEKPNSSSTFKSKATHKPNPARHLSGPRKSVHVPNRERFASIGYNHTPPALNSNLAAVYDIPLVCTQDLLMSSQDIDELSGKPTPSDLSPRKSYIAGTNRALDCEKNDASSQTSFKPTTRHNHASPPTHHSGTIDSGALDVFTQFDFDDDLVAETWERVEAASSASKSGSGTPQPSQAKKGSQPSIQNGSSGMQGKASQSSHHSGASDRHENPKESPTATPCNFPNTNASSNGTSPQPFFTNSCKEGKWKFVLERSKTLAWEAPAARQGSQERFPSIRRQEEERYNELMMAEIMNDDTHSDDEKPNHEDKAAKPNSGAVPAEQAVLGVPSQSASSSASGPLLLSQSNLGSRQHHQISASHRPAERDLSSHSLGREQQRQRSLGQTNNDSNEETTPSLHSNNSNSRPLSSYAKMLLKAGLSSNESALKEGAKETTTTILQQQQNPSAVPCSQETDYGDAELDNELRDMI